MPQLPRATDTGCGWCNSVTSHIRNFLWSIKSFMKTPWAQRQLIMTPRIQELHFTLIAHLIFHVLILLLLTRWGYSHPQCLDYKPPFQPQQPLVFCKEYSKFGCCDLQKDEEIRTRFYMIMENFDHSGYVTCSRYIHSILCQVGDAVYYFTNGFYC